MPIGVYFTISKGWLLLPLLIAAAACVLLYTPVMLKRPWLAVKVVRAPWAYQNPAELMPLLGNNVLIILLTQVLLGAGYLLNVILKSA